MSQTPKFESRNAATPAFWDERFAARFLPWDQGGMPDDARRYFETLVPNAHEQCLIPGCGNAYEAAYLTQRGWNVAAIDFSSEAVGSARKLHPALADRIVLADFFSYQPERPLQCIYERAFLCALPPARRGDIAARWAALLPIGGVLAGYFFIQDEAQAGSSDKIGGPPFAIDARQLTALLSPNFSCIEDRPVTDSIAVFNNRERWQVWRRI